MIRMAKKAGRRKRAALAVLLCLLLIGAAAILGWLWTQYRSYPYNYRQDIEQYAAQNNLDPLFVTAIIRTESGWKLKAVSTVGARGLMQIMPETGGWIASNNSWEYSDDMLFDGAYNVRLGCWYVNYLLKQYDGNQTLALAAYNAGQANVDKWVAEGRFADGKSDIHFTETRNFVKRVKDAYEKYKSLY